MGTIAVLLTALVLGLLVVVVWVLMGDPLGSNSDGNKSATTVDDTSDD